MTKKRFEDLTFCDNYMFVTILDDPKNVDIAKRIVELALNRKVKDIKLSSTEKKVISRYGGKVTIFDVQVEGSNEYVDIEMQMEKKDSFALRTRAYHSNMDAKYIKEGTEYKDLKESIVIFICKQDYFNKHLPRYTFHTYCKETKELKLKDKRTTIFLNPKSETKDKDLKAFLRFIEDNSVTDALSERIDSLVENTKKDEEARSDYMTFDEYVEDEKVKAKKLGKAEGIREGLAKGEMNRNIAIAKEMLSNDLSIDMIQKYTGLSEEEILKLK